MATQVQFRGGTTSEHSTFTGAAREVTVDTDKDTLVVHDGSTAGGFPIAKESGSTFTNVDINSGTIDGVTIGGASAPTVTNLGSVATCDINGGTIDGVTIGGASAGAGTFTTLEADDGNVGTFVSITAATSPKFTITSTGEQLLLQGATNGVGQSVDLFFEQLLTSGTTSRRAGKISSIAVGTYTAGNSATNDSDLAFYTAQNGTDNERLRITEAGLVAPGADNTQDLGSSSLRWNDLFLGGSVYLGGTTSANALDDYEEGTWDPVFAGTSTAGTYTYFTRNSRYTKVGNSVTVHCSLINITESVAGTGNVVITGLPFTSSNITALSYTAPVNISRFDLNGEGQIATINPNSSEVSILLMTSGTGAAVVLAVADRTSDNSDIIFTITYQAA